MARYTLDTSDMLSRTADLSKQFAEFAKIDGGLDSLFCAKSVDPWHGCGIDVPENCSVGDLAKLAFPSGDDIVHVPVFAAHPDVAENIRNLDLISIASKASEENFAQILFDELARNGVLIAAPSSSNRDEKKRRSMISGACPEYRGVVLRGNPDHIVPALQKTQMLGIVGSQHTSVTGEQMVSFAELLGKAYGAENVVPLTAGSLDSAGILFMSLKLNGMGFRAPTWADKNFSHVSLIQGTSGALAFTKSLSNITIVCRNTATHAAKDRAAFKTKHTKKVHERLADHVKAEANEFVDNLQKMNDAFSNWAEMAANTKLNSEQIENAIGMNLFGVERWNEYRNGGRDLASDQHNNFDVYNVAHRYSPGQRARGVDQNANSGTAWTLYNALTFMRSNVLPTYANSSYRLAMEEDESQQFVQNYLQMI